MKKTRWTVALAGAAALMINFATGCATNRSEARAGEREAVHAADVQAGEQQAQPESGRLVVTKHGPRRR